PCPEKGGSKFRCVANTWENGMTKFQQRLPTTNNKQPTTNNNDKLQREALWGAINSCCNAEGAGDVKFFHQSPTTTLVVKAAPISTMKATLQNDFSCISTPS
ncbi:MAG TPA: hypothetical protein DCP31_12315, partial [Cyanobacteria bacterium UBA8543]|nr:hypothetical protein [Cyanobacteria bacterium UBA8543]